ncbi:uncharacterized protein MONOS_2789 [Monocercomonoides exilis]|uniref:uncharacterized protein n=1 Tax=Monocercomonoides exilis TaxID=2049356 RepID=UPI003559CB4A|nr:hypothetical protein MONOS_2789 [Monocercomonoides exilis]|eukprot:MONOS_2789.1-p1 / transcript=MONOS_2789.1 / gene=MONOS_2789 / organism=Monocercomonoides_exilis_PA203 / gene_product=,translation / transcript_product=,translation / location=Mono_scaffold00060:7876-12886(-) / protein_length=1487 / sequence_SO=supercontig / SO=protein_coding / is_pseudo=false
MQTIPDVQADQLTKDALRIGPKGKKLTIKRGKGCYPFSLGELCIGPYQIPLGGSSPSPPTEFNFTRHFNDPILTQAVASKNTAVTLALLAENPHNIFYNYLRKWYTSFAIHNGLKSIVVQFVHAVHTYRMHIPFDTIEKIALSDENGNRYFCNRMYPQDQPDEVPKDPLSCFTYLEIYLSQPPKLKWAKTNHDIRDGFFNPYEISNPMETKGAEVQNVSSFPGINTKRGPVYHPCAADRFARLDGITIRFRRYRFLLQDRWIDDPKIRVPSHIPANSAPLPPSTLLEYVLLSEPHLEHLLKEQNVLAQSDSPHIPFALVSIADPASSAPRAVQGLTGYLPFLFPSAQTQQGEPAALLGEQKGEEKDLDKKGTKEEFINSLGEVDERKAQENEIGANVLSNESNISNTSSTIASSSSSSSDMSNSSSSPSSSNNESLPQDPSSSSNTSSSLTSQSSSPSSSSSALSVTSAPSSPSSSSANPSSSIADEMPIAQLAVVDLNSNDDDRLATELLRLFDENSEIRLLLTGILQSMQKQKAIEAAFINYITTSQRIQPLPFPSQWLFTQIQLANVEEIPPLAPSKREPDAGSIFPFYPLNGCGCRSGQCTTRRCVCYLAGVGCTHRCLCHKGGPHSSPHNGAPSIQQGAENSATPLSGGLPPGFGSTPFPLQKLTQLNGVDAGSGDMMGSSALGNGGNPGAGGDSGIGGGGAGNISVDDGSSASSLKLPGIADLFTATPVVPTHAAHEEVLGMMMNGKLGEYLAAQPCRNVFNVIFPAYGILQAAPCFASYLRHTATTLVTLQTQHRKTPAALPRKGRGRPRKRDHDLIVHNPTGIAIAAPRQQMSGYGPAGGDGGAGEQMHQSASSLSLPLLPVDLWRLVRESELYHYCCEEMIQLWGFDEEDAWAKAQMQQSLMKMEEKENGMDELGGPGGAGGGLDGMGDGSGVSAQMSLAAQQTLTQPLTVAWRNTVPLLELTPRQTYILQEIFGVHPPIAVVPLPPNAVYAHPACAQLVTSPFSSSFPKMKPASSHLLPQSSQQQSVRSQTGSPSFPDSPLLSDAPDVLDSGETPYLTEFFTGAYLAALPPQVLTFSFCFGQSSQVQQQIQQQLSQQLPQDPSQMALTSQLAPGAAASANMLANAALRSIDGPPVIRVVGDLSVYPSIDDTQRVRGCIVNRNEVFHCSRCDECFHGRMWHCRRCNRCTTAIDGKPCEFCHPHKREGVVIPRWDKARSQLHLGIDGSLSIGDGSAVGAVDSQQQQGVNAQGELVGERDKMKGSNVKNEDGTGQSGVNSSSSSASQAAGVSMGVSSQLVYSDMGGSPSHLQSQMMHISRSVTEEGETSETDSDAELDFSLSHSYQLSCNKHMQNIEARFNTLALAREPIPPDIQDEVASIRTTVDHVQQIFSQHLASMTAALSSNQAVFSSSQGMLSSSGSLSSLQTMEQQIQEEQDAVERNNRMAELEVTGVDDATKCQEPRNNVNDINLMDVGIEGQ